MYRYKTKTEYEYAIKNTYYKGLLWTYLLISISIVSSFVSMSYLHLGAKGMCYFFITSSCSHFLAGLYILDRTTRMYVSSLSLLHLIYFNKDTYQRMMLYNMGISISNSIGQENPLKDPLLFHSKN